MKAGLVANLLGLLPIDMAEIILREPTNSADNLEYVKGKFLERFQMSPEDFRIKFVNHERQTNYSWRDFSFSLTNYLGGWLEGIKIT